MARIAATGDVAAAQSMAAHKAARYATNPKALEADIAAFSRRLAAFRKAIDDIWGPDERREPTPRTYVKYSEGYKARALVDFDAGTVIVETLDRENPRESLRQAVVTTLLAPGDPRAVDLYSASEIRFGDTPFLYNEVLDVDGKPIRWQWRAERFAERLLEKGVVTRSIGKGRTATRVSFPLVRDHLHIRARKYAELVAAQSKRFGVSRNLVYAVIKTESDFNPFATSPAPAFGLMQIVPKSAGAEVNRMLNGSPQPPSREFLFEAANNIRYGTAYLHILDTRHLARIENPISREYCVIAAYNTGAGNVLRSFSANRDTAVARINALTPAQVFDTLRAKLPYAETRRYLMKVLDAKKLFVGA
ncbi:membrane-bound lytic murein transglycosylase C [Desulfobaculum xiamenense]|uniref:Membrane-bound lytic murein transglycosylase C n=1 Tax=Desulfobaculum xiamenense TaxID=995050 RepID=A0A846QJQ6_9BACT|nr:murein transglycosylase domain-containing protein [Desulfobaculum xiamenense]NJB67337.1 membrane-bound lytic murein transglycosylase C [Desulfobaculum xiamenense]